MVPKVKSLFLTRGKVLNKHYMIDYFIYRFSSLFHLESVQPGSAKTRLGFKTRRGEEVEEIGAQNTTRNR